MDKFSMVDLKLCLCMASHNRLGQGSSMSQISQDCIRKIMEFFLKQIVKVMSKNTYIHHQFSIILSNMYKNTCSIRPNLFSLLTVTKKERLLMKIIDSVRIADEAYNYRRPEDFGFPKFTKKIPQIVSSQVELYKFICGHMSLYNFKNILRVSDLYMENFGSLDKKHNKRINFIKQQIEALSKIDRKDVLLTQLSNLGHYKYWERFNRATSEDNSGKYRSHKKNCHMSESYWDNGKNVNNEEEEDDLFFC